MEPIAPGTEDEPLVIFSSATKQERERERLIGVKAILPSGKYGNVYDFNYISGTEHWYCNACQCPVMGWVFHHENGKRHKIALGNQASERVQESGVHESEEPPSIQIAPGEPVPPGFEGQIEKIALIQERLDCFNVGPLVALEYLLELKDYDLTKEPNYLCLLCDKKGDPRTVLTHLASYKHILQYLQKHFPTCYRALAPYMTKQYKMNWQRALHEIAEAIEKKFGRLKPIPVEADKYEKDPVYYIQIVAKGRHFSELSGYTFEELINKDELTKARDEEDKFGYGKTQRKKSPSPPVVANPIKKVRMSSAPAPATEVGSRRRSLSSVSSVSSSELSDFEEKQKKVQRNPRSRSPVHRNRSRSPYSRRFNRRSPPRREGHNRRDDRERDRRDLMPWERPNYRRPRSDYSIDNRNKVKDDKSEEYKKLCKAIDNDMERILKNHKKNPEKHPQYNDEWKKFWNKRYKELQTEGKDVSGHDFKPEWIEFWNKRMIELHQDEMKSRKEALKKRLGLNEDPSPISFKIVPKKKFESRDSPKPIPPSAQPDNDPEVIVINDGDDDTKSSRRSHSPWEDEPPVAKKPRERSKEPKTRESKPERDKRSKSPLPVSRNRDRSYEKGRRSKSPRPVSRDRDRSYEKNKRSKSPRPVSRDRDRSYERERDYKSKKYEARGEYRRERIRVSSELPWERNKYYKNDMPSYYKPPSVMRDVTREPVLSPISLNSTQMEEEDDGDVNVVAVLRLLTALEEKLGSLGPKVIDLLGQALAMEKNEANSSDTLLDNDINCVMFETVKEKLKGQLLAGLVEPIQEKAFKNAIKKTASVIHMAGERKKEKEKNQPKVDPVKVPGVGTVDKAAIAKQIANALILQGKTDVSQAELEQLINAVVGMAEASRKSDKPMNTAAFLEHISKVEEKPKSPPPKEIKPTPVITPPPAPSVAKTPEKSYPNNMEGLSDSDLQTLLENFKDLSTEEQFGLINYLKKLEAIEPDRVERLRKFVNLGPSKEKVAPPPPSVERKSDRESPFSNRTGSVNPTLDDKNMFVEPEESQYVRKETKVRLPIDSDEEDYSFEDVAKAASKNVKEKELEKEREIVEESMKFDAKRDKDINLDETKAIISNIMGNINKLDQGNLLGLGVSSADLANTLNNLPVSIDSLANIVGSVQGFTRPSVTHSVTQPRPQLQQVNQAPKPQLQQANQGPRPDFGYAPPYQGGNFQPNYGQQFQNRPNVSYPIDKTRLTYPNYGVYGHNNEGNQYGQQRPRGNPPQFGGNNQFKPHNRGNNPNNNFNIW